MKRKFEYAIVGGVLVYLGLLLFPQPLFRYKLEREGFTLYSVSPLKAEDASAALEGTAARLKRAGLAPARTRYKVFLCGGTWRYAFFVPGARGAYGATYPYFTDNIFLYHADPASGAAFKKDSTAVRSLGGTLAHEITHILIRKNLAFREYLALDEWKEEGYCDYVSGESSFDRRKGLVLMLKGEDVPGRSFKYFKWRLLVEYLVESKGLSLAELGAGELDPLLLEKPAAAWALSRGGP